MWSAPFLSPLLPLAYHPVTRCGGRLLSPPSLLLYHPISPPYSLHSQTANRSGLLSRCQLTTAVGGLELLSPAQHTCEATTIIPRGPPLLRDLPPLDPTTHDQCRRHLYSMACLDLTFNKSLTRATSPSNLPCLDESPTG